MADQSIILTGELAEQLQTLAAEKNLSVEEMLASFVESTQARIEHNWAFQMGQLAEDDTEINWKKDISDLATRSREILDEAYGAYLNPDE